MREMQQEAGAETRAGAYDVNRLDAANKLALAGLTRGSTTAGNQTSTSTGNIKQSTSPWGTAAIVGAQAAPLSL
jgi:hypothetical protein